MLGVDRIRRPSKKEIEECKELWVYFFKQAMHVLIDTKEPGSTSQSWATASGKHADICVEEYKKRFIKE